MDYPPKNGRCREVAFVEMWLLVKTPLEPLKLVRDYEGHIRAQDSLFSLSFPTLGILVSPCSLFC